jgi:hypothetical protein
MSTRSSRAPRSGGNRTGHEGTVSCSATETFSTEEGLTLTGFFDFTATQQDKGN